MAYCEVEDMLTGNIPAPAALDPQRFVNDAADEMDSILGRRFVTPIELDDTPAYRAGKLMLKRINAHLSTGRLIMAADAGGEDRDLHAYGLYLVKCSLEALEAIALGQVQVPGADPVDGTDVNSPTAPAVFNVDEESLVEAFSGMFQNPILPPRITELPYAAYYRIRGG